MTDESLFIGVSRAAPPASGVVRLLSPAQEISSGELSDIAGPKVILGGAPCAHWSEVIRDRTDTLYVVVGGGGVPDSARAVATELPAAPASQLRRYFSQLLVLRNLYPEELPRLEGANFCWKGRRVPLTETELAVMQRLMELLGSVVSRGELGRIARVPGEGSRALEAHVHRLRHKLRVPGVEIVTERQRGFRLVLS